MSAAPLFFELVSSGILGGVFVIDCICLRVSRSFAKCFSLYSCNQCFMRYLFAKVLSFTCYFCGRGNTKDKPSESRVNNY